MREKVCNWNSHSLFLFIGYLATDEKQTQLSLNWLPINYYIKKVRLTILGPAQNPVVWLNIVES